MTPGVCTECSKPIQEELVGNLCIVCLAVRFGGEIWRERMEKAVEQDKADAASRTAAQTNRRCAQDEEEDPLPQTETQKG